MSDVSPDWARSLTDPQLFREEQRTLAHVWTFLGLADDVARDGDWMRASIATRSVFVQRFGEELRGFENLCVHRFYPLRNADRGNGPVICGFHGWQYGRDGQAVGIPRCKDVYGKPPHEMGARLNRIELATCGPLIFGRFPSPAATQSLEEYLGEALPILAAMTRMKSRPRYTRREIRANWKLNLHITLDDYHSPMVHPSTFGRVGYLDPSDCRYIRLGAHSAFLLTKDEDGPEKLKKACRDGDYRSTDYFILQILPDLVVSHVDADTPFWFCNIQQFSALAPDRTAFRSWSYPAPFASDMSWFTRTTRPLTDPWRRHIYYHYYKRVLREDMTICERIQKSAHQIESSPMLGALEERIGWFENDIRTLAGTAKEETAQ
jgi:phenylpropionate dioxygenase-like ring-hydroxylating dioxygenase large terminal subunit